jgi:hypothetical protein
MGLGRVSGQPIMGTAETIPVARLRTIRQPGDPSTAFPTPASPVHDADGARPSARCARGSISTIRAA